MKRQGEAYFGGLRQAVLAARRLPLSGVWGFGWRKRKITVHIASLASPGWN
jgi:hypothetical protein